MSAAFGGFNHITIARNGAYSVSPSVLPRERLDALRDHLLLGFTGISRPAADVAQTVVGNLKRNAAEMGAIQQIVDRTIKILSTPATDIIEFGRLLRESWALKRSLSDRVSNPTVDHLVDTATHAGAIGGKLLGAGGGGFMLLFVRPEDHAQVRAALGKFISVPFRFETSGSRIALYQPDGL